MTGPDLLAWLNALGLSPRQGAEALAISRQQMYRYLNGTYPIPAPVAKLAKLMEENRQ